jgi:hypothetical protein
MSRLVVGLDLEHLNERRADHDLLALVRSLPDGAVAAAATHWAQLGERPHVALSMELAGTDADGLLQLLSGLAPRWSLALAGEVHGDPALAAPAEAARTAHADRRSGRAVHFPGAGLLVGTLAVREVLERSAVDRVCVLTAGDAAPDAAVVTREHVRPTWQGGELVLLTQPAVGGTLVPFETPDPTPCCVDH